MFDWQNLGFDTMNLILVLVTSGFLVRDVRAVLRRQHRRLFSTELPSKIHSKT